MSDVSAVASDRRKVPVAVQVRPQLSPLTLYSSQMVDGRNKGSTYLADPFNHLYLNKYYKQKDENGVVACWRCYKSRSTGCPAIVFTRQASEADPIMITKYSDKMHDHIPDLSDQLKNSSKAKVRSLALQDQTIKPRALFSNLTNTMSTSGEVWSISPKALSSAVQRDRAKQVTQLDLH